MSQIGRKRGPPPRYSPFGSGSSAKAFGARQRPMELMATGLTLDGLFTKFASYLRGSEDNTVKKALELMFPNSMGESSKLQFITLLLYHCQKPLQLVKTATMPLEGPEAKQLAGIPDGTYDKQHAMKIKYYTGMLFSIENGTFAEGQNIIEFHKLNQPFFNGFIYDEKKFSERIAAMTALEKAVQAPQAQAPQPPLAGWSSIDIYGKQLPYIKVDEATAEFISQYYKYSVGEKIQSLNEFLKDATDITTRVTIIIGTSTIKVSIYTLLWLTKFIYDFAIVNLGWFGSILNGVVEKLIANQDFLFSGPFQNINDPDPEESKIRRANRIVFTFFYTMVDLLIFIRENGIITQDLSLALNTESETNLPTFIASEPSTWTLDKIFTYGPAFYVAVMGRRRTPEMGYLHEYYDSYDKSIGIVTSLLDNRIFDARIKIETLKTALSPLAIATEAPAISNATPEQIRVVQTAIQQLINLGGMTDDLARGLMASGWLQDPDGAAGTAAAQVAATPAGMDTDGPDGLDGDGSLVSGLSGGGMVKRRRKTTKRRRKTTRRRKSKRRSYKKTSKSKKGRKYKRRSMREVKDKLIHLINSL